MKKIQLSSVIQQRIPAISFGCLQAGEIKVIKNDPGFINEFAHLEKELKEKFNHIAPSQNHVVSATRKMYRLAGWEPTKYRPSSEALIRRILQDKGLYRINNLVDYANLVSARYHIPMGLYDIDKIYGEIVLDIGHENEYYQGISKPKISANGKIILRDDVGIFGNPTADSIRTSIQDTTKNIFAVFFIGKDIPTDYCSNMLAELSGFYSRFTSNEILRRFISF